MVSYTDISYLPLIASRAWLYEAARGNGDVAEAKSELDRVKGSAKRPPRLFIDGYNLALDQGTGVATYARNLSFALERLGFGIGVLYGTRPTQSVDPLIREIAF